MSYLFIVIIGAIAGWVAGQYLKGSEQGPMLDVAAGAIGACIAVVLVRMVGPAAAAGFMLSSVVAIVGAIGSVFGVRQYQKSKQVPAPRVRRRT